MNAVSIAAITGAAVSLTVDGKTLRVKPFSIAKIGELSELMADSREHIAPRIDEAIKAIPKDTPPAIVKSIIDAVVAARRELLEPTFEQVCEWILFNPIHLCKAVWLCVDEGDRQQVEYETFCMAIRAIGDQGDFLQRWKVASGLAEPINPSNSTPHTSAVAE